MRCRPLESTLAADSMKRSSSAPKALAWREMAHSAPRVERSPATGTSAALEALAAQSKGSGAGIRQLTEGTVDFGASDGPMTDAQLKAYQDKHGFPILHFPTVLGADVPTYNIPGVSAELNFTPQALAGIFLGKVTKWNDPLITGPNKGVNLPANDILVVHRSEGSGTTYIWTDYLSKVSEEWKTRVGKGTAVNWPVGLGGQGNEGKPGPPRSLKSNGIVTHDRTGRPLRRAGRKRANARYCDTGIKNPGSGVVAN